MYVTRPLSSFRNFPSSLSTPPPEGPNSGFLVVQDEEAEATTCFGLCKDRQIGELPIPQNKKITIRYATNVGENRTVSYYDVLFVPVLNRPLSSNLYYAIRIHGSHAGEAYACSREEDNGTCCFWNYVKDVSPKPLDLHDTYQQFEICNYQECCNRGFYAKSIAPDGTPPNFLRRKGWEISGKTPKNYELTVAEGVDKELRARLPAFAFPLSQWASANAVVGKWYIPFMFVKEKTLKDQVKMSPFYEMTLEQRWEKIFECNNQESRGNNVVVDTTICSEEAFVSEMTTTWDEGDAINGVVMFTGNGAHGSVVVGLSVELIHRMKWLQERAGWVSGKGRQIRVTREEEFGGMGEWGKFGCYVLVERFVLKRMDGSLVLTYKFTHIHQIRAKWE